MWINALKVSVINNGGIVRFENGNHRLVLSGDIYYECFVTAYVVHSELSAW